jgi:hypothetical protein
VPVSFRKQRTTGSTVQAVQYKRHKRSSVVCAQQWKQLRAGALDASNEAQHSSPTA